MSKKQFKSQASSSRAVSSTFGSILGTFSNGSSGATLPFGAVSASPLSYVYESPDLSRTSEPNVVVAFKNLQKKDGTTKAKALEDLQAYVTSDKVQEEGLENPVLETWIKLYPRTSIDSSRRVRQLAHTLQGEISSSCGKRIARHMPMVVGAWLAGLYDNDKHVALAAQEAFRKVFSSQSKQYNVWLIYRKAIFEYCRDAILREDVGTLSDERTTSPDVAKAKHAQVIGTALLTVSNAIAVLPASELLPHSEPYTEILRAQYLWRLASHDDPFVRKAVYNLLSSIVQKPELDDMDYSLISLHVLQETLHVDQARSAYEYIKTLTTLSATCPGVWTKYYAGSGKRSAGKRLCQFLSHGSQGGPPQFWKQVLLLIHEVPLEVSRAVNERAEDLIISEDTRPIYPLLDALQNGITRKDEHPANHVEAWRTYLAIAEVYSSSLSAGGAQRAFLEVHVVPIMNQYLKPKVKGEKWAVLGSGREDTIKDAMRLIANRCPEAFESSWKFLSDTFIQKLKLSLPEQSKDYTTSQDSVTLTAERWYALYASIIQSRSFESVQATLLRALASEVNAAVEILRSRNGKPYGAAAALEAAVRWVVELSTQVSATKKVLLDFIKFDLPGLLLSPSSAYLIRMLNVFKNEPGLKEFWHETIRTLTEAPNTTTKFIALQSLISSPGIGRKGLSEEVAATVKQSLQHALHGNIDFWPIVTAAISNSSLPDTLTEDLLVSMTESLSIETEMATGLHGLNLVSKEDQRVVLDFTASSKGASLLSKLLFLMESQNPDISSDAQKLDSMIRRMNSSDGGPRLAQSSMINLVRNGLETADVNSLSIMSLKSEATELLRHATTNDRSDVAEALLPDAPQWARAFTPFLLYRPDTALAITNPLGGAIYMVDKHPEDGSRFSDKTPRDKNGYSSAWRMAWYVVTLCESSRIFDILTPSRRTIVFRYIALFVQLSADNLSVPHSQGLWLWSQTQQDATSSEVATQAQSLLTIWLRGSSASDLDLIELTLESLLRNSEGTSVVAYYNARAYIAITSELDEINRKLLSKDGQHHAGALQESVNPLTATAVLVSAQNPEMALQACNRLIADLTSLQIVNNLVKGLRELVLLNSAIRQLQELDHLDKIPQPRLVLFTKHITSQLQHGFANLHVIAEMYKVLFVILSLIKDIYGSFWEEIIEIMVGGCSRAVNEHTYDIPFMHASLKLHDIIRRLATTSVENEDLTEAWANNKAAATESLVGLLKLQASLPDEANQPRRILNELLERQLTSPNTADYDSAEELYPIMACESAALQHAAYEMLHRRIPEKQEDASIEAALSKSSEVKLSEELLSLILAVPQHDEPLILDWENLLPLSLRGYLLSWVLVFDHWANASYKLQNDYVTCIKEGSYLGHFLAFASHQLIGSRVNPIDGSRYNPETYSPGLEDNPEKDAAALITHVYYLCLKNLPTLSKAWWRNVCPRQLQKPVEAWTEKYISPQVIATELATVTAWLPTQDTTSEPLTVKVSARAHEVTASYPLDEQHMSIRIILPPTYPLAPVLVESVHRVGIDEKKWRSWLLTTAGVINFSGTSGVIIEGLVAWRKNVTGALKGQSECAICYSVVSTDKQLPSKRCGTCRNLFHGSCLFRWFRSSGSSSCPLCRNAFNYG